MKIFSKDKYSDDELELIELEHRKAYLRLFKSTVFVQALFPIVLTYVFYSLLPKKLLFSWLLAILLITLIRAYLTFGWYKIEFAPNKTKVFETLSLALAFVAGGLWGITVLIMNFNQYPEASVFLNIVVFGLTAGSVGIGSYWFSYFITYNLTVFSFYIIVYLIGMPEQYYLLAISLSLFFIFMVQIALVFHRGNAQNIWLIKRNEKLAENLSEKRRQAEDFASSRSRFLTSASHDLRQPLQALNLFLSALQPELKSQKSQLLYSKLEKSAEGMNELLNSILDISKLDANTLTFNRKPCCLNRILDNLKQQFQMQAEEKKLVLIFHPTNHYVESDPVLLQRILSNLISNAINYTVAGKVEVSLCIAEDTLIIKVIDTGLGLDEVDQKQIFEEFYQLNNPERDRKKGLGLGLSIVKRLCFLMNIPLEVNSKKGQGSCFSISLPLCSAAEQTNRKETAIPHRHPSSEKILVIDDEISIREGLSALLSQWYHHVATAGSADEACKIIEKKGYIPDLIIADYRLRDNKTGVEAVCQIKKLLNRRKINAIIISGDTEPSRLKDVAQSGYELLHKPVKPAQLRMVIQQKLTQDLNV